MLYLIKIAKKEFFLMEKKEQLSIKQSKKEIEWVKEGNDLSNLKCCKVQEILHGYG